MALYHLVQSRCLTSVWAHCTIASQSRCQEYLDSLSPGHWRRPLGRPDITWVKTIQQDLKSKNLSLNEAIDKLRIVDYAEIDV